MGGAPRPSPPRPPPPPKLAPSPQSRRKPHRTSSGRARKNHRPAPTGCPRSSFVRGCMHLPLRSIALHAHFVPPSSWISYSRRPLVLVPCDVVIVIHQFIR